MKIHSVYLIGVGGSGSAASEPVSRLLHYHPKSEECSILFCDGDFLEDKNCVRQSFASSAVGKNKAQLKASELSKEIGHEIAALPEYLKHKQIIKLIESNPPSSDSLTILLCCVDNDASRLECLKAMDKLKSLNILLMTPGNGLDKGQLMTWGYIFGRPTDIDIRELFPQLAKPKDHVPTSDPNSCLVLAPSTPQLISANEMAAMTVLSNLQLLLDRDQFWGLIYFDVYGARMQPDSETLVDIEVLKASESTVAELKAAIPLPA